MLGKKYLNTVIKTIKSAPEAEVNGAVLGDTIFSAINKSYLMDFIKSKIQPKTEGMRILVDLVNKNYFDLFYKQDYDKAVEQAKKILKAHGASETQTDEFLNTFFDFTNLDSEISEEVDSISISEYAEENPEKIDDTEEIKEIENKKEVESDELLDTEKGENSEHQGDKEILETEKIEEDEIEVEEADDIKEEAPEEETVENEVIVDEKTEIEESTKIENTVSKKKKSFDGKGSFAVRIIFAFLLFIIALVAIKPTGTDKFYLAYYVIFGLFSLGALFCCVVAQKDISLLWNFYETFRSSRGRSVDLKSDNKAIDDICSAYKGSFLLNETYNKTRANADLYFGGETYFNDMNKLPIQSFLKIIPGTFIGFGILGTFVGFAGGLSSINIADSQSLLNGVQNLLDGLKSAFNTSIVGVLASMFLNFFMIHPLFNCLDRCSKDLCDYLDTKFFVSEVDAMSVTDENNKQIPFPQTMGIVLEKLEQVASNINQMGATVGDQVTQSVKATLDKTIEKIIKEEIKKLKEEMNTSIFLLQECQQHLQNAPVHLKEAAEKMEEAAKNNDELFKKQNQESVEAYSKVVELSLSNYKQKLEGYTQSIEANFNNLNLKFADYTKSIEETSKEMLNIKNTLALMPEDFSNIDKSIQATTEKLSSNQTTLGNALTESTQAFDKTTEISEALTDAYDSQSKKIEEMISKFTDVLNEYKETSKESKELLAGFKGMDEQIAKIFERINENTQTYSEVIGNSLKDYLSGFTDATKDVGAKFANATDALREEVEKLNKTAKENK